MYVKLPKNTDSNNFLTNRGKLSGYQKGIDKGQRKNPKIRHSLEQYSTHETSMSLEPLSSNITQEDRDLIIASKMLAKEGGI